jgi:serine/threonine protein phosphatase 1
LEFGGEMALFRRKKTRHKPRLPEGIRIYAIGDIHGRADLLQQLFTVIDNDLARSAPERAIQVFLGDYVDRGPDSRGVLDLLIDRQGCHETVFLKGNHEAFFLDVLQDPAKLQDWRNYGGLTTLMSYGVQPSMKPTAEQQIELIDALARSMPAEHLAFLRNLPLSFDCGDFFFAHAGVRPGLALDRQTEADLLWIREEFLNSEEDFGKLVVHGHTPVATPDFRPNRINIDTGAYATGNLTLLTIQGDSLLAI